MGDRYQPPVYRGRPPNGRDDRFDTYDRYDRCDRYDHRDQDYHDRLRRQPPPDRYDDRHGGGYTFRGAADNDTYRPRREHEDFTFRAQGPAATRFPSPDRYAPLPQKPRRRPAEESHGERGGRGKGGARGGRAGKFGDHKFMRQRHGKGAAHSRGLMNEHEHTRRGSTPEQLPGMITDGQSRFMVLDSSESDNDSDSHGIIDLTNGDSDHGEGEVSDAPRKRAKVDDSVQTAAPATKWSNAEYLTALPPPETLGVAPKRDILQVIRKAKVDAAPKAESTNAVKENADFVSFDFGAETGDDDDDSAADDLPPSDAPAAPAAMKKLNREQAPNRGKFPVAPPTNTTASYDLDMSDPGSPPRPPADLLMPTDAELAAQYVKGPKGKKRKREEQSEDIGGVSREWREDGSNTTPWCTTDHSATEVVALRLHKEICDFFEFVRPHDHEIKLRRELVQRVQRALRSITNMAASKDVDVRSFGSFASGLYLPTADMDLVAVSPSYMRTGVKAYCQTKTQIFKLAGKLPSSGLAAPASVNPIVGAKVPIVKLTDKITGIKIDISFESDGGLRANNTVLEWKEQFPDMPVLVALIKQMLAMRELNDVASGGLGGFSIICLVTSMMQLMSPREWDNTDPAQRYGELLMKFLDFYGNHFDITRTGIIMSPPGYYDKINHPRPGQNARRLTIINPNDPNRDVSGGSRHIDQVFDCFRSAHAAIQRRLARIDSGVDIGESILRCVWGGNYSSFVFLRNNLYKLHTGHLPAPPPPKQLNAPKFGSFQGKPQRKQKLDHSFVPGGKLDMQHPLPPRPGDTSSVRSGDEASSKANKKYVDPFFDSVSRSSLEHHIYSSLSDHTDADVGDTRNDGRDTDKHYLASVPQTNPNFNMGYRRTSPILMDSDDDEEMADAPVNFDHPGNSTIDLVESEDGADSLSSLGAETLFEMSVTSRPPPIKKPKTSAQKKEARANKRTTRAEQFKQEYPHIPDVPNSLSVAGARKLRDKHDLPKGVTKKGREHYEALRARAEQLRQEHPEIAHIPEIVGIKKAKKLIRQQKITARAEKAYQARAQRRDSDASLTPDRTAHHVSKQLPMRGFPGSGSESSNHLNPAHGSAYQPSGTELASVGHHSTFDKFRPSGPAYETLLQSHGSHAPSTHGFTPINGFPYVTGAYNGPLLSTQPAAGHNSVFQSESQHVRDSMQDCPVIDLTTDQVGEEQDDKSQPSTGSNASAVLQAKLANKSRNRAMTFERLNPDVQNVPVSLSREEYDILVAQIESERNKGAPSHQLSGLELARPGAPSPPDVSTMNDLIQERKEQLKQPPTGPRLAQTGFELELIASMQRRAAKFKETYPEMKGVPDQLSAEEFQGMKSRATSFKQSYPGIVGVPEGLTKQGFKKLKKQHGLN